MYMYSVSLHTGNIRVFCRVRPLLSGEISASALDGSTEIISRRCTVHIQWCMYIHVHVHVYTKLSGCSAGSQAAARDKGSLHIEFPDKDRDCKKITVHFTPQKVDKPTKVFMHMCIYNVQVYWCS